MKNVIRTSVQNGQNGGHGQNAQKLVVMGPAEGLDSVWIIWVNQLMKQIVLEKTMKLRNVHYKIVHIGQNGQSGQNVL